MLDRLVSSGDASKIATSTGRVFSQTRTDLSDIPQNLTEGETDFFRKRQQFDAATPDLAEFPDAGDGGFIKSKGQLLGDVLTSGPIKLAYDFKGVGEDLVRSGREMLELRRDPVFEGIGVPHGDGSPVRVLGGFYSSQAHYFDFTTGLNHANYKAETLPWGHANVLAPFKMADYMMPTIEQVRKETGHKVKLVVHSLGGYDTTAMILKYPERFVDSVEHVVFIGSPIPNRLNSALALGYLVVHMFEGGEEFEMAKRLDVLEPIIESGLVKFTSIDSSRDPIVGGQHLSYNRDHYIIPEASHGALGMNRHSLNVVTNAFAGEEVDPNKYPYIHHPTQTSLAA